MEEKLGIRGDVVATLRDENGYILQREEKRNLIVTVGKNFLASLLAGDTSTVMSHIAIADDGTEPISSQTALVASTELARAAALVESGTGGNSNKVTYTITFAGGTGTGTIAEAGIFNASSAGTMLSRIVFDPTLPKGVTDTLTITWTITYPL